MFGPQPVSARRSSPSYGFGSGTREGQAKLFVSNAHAAGSSGFSPGPASIGARDSLGKQSDGRRVSAPTWVFGTGERFKYESRAATSAPGPGAYAFSGSFGQQTSSSIRSQPKFGFGSAGRQHVEKVFVSEEHNKSLFGTQSPGPASYGIKGSLGKQDTSRLGTGETQPSWVFGSTKRFQYDHVKRAANSPGPGQYGYSTGVGRQSLSTRQSSPNFGFGTSDRSHQAKVYMSPEHEKMNHGLQSPGPATYGLNGSVGVQRLSKDHSAASWCAATPLPPCIPNLRAPRPGSPCLPHAPPPSLSYGGARSPLGCSAPPAAHAAHAPPPPPRAAGALAPRTAGKAPRRARTTRPDPAPTASEARLPCLCACVGGCARARLRRGRPLAFVTASGPPPPSPYVAAVSGRAWSYSGLWWRHGDASGRMRVCIVVFLFFCEFPS